MKIHKAKLPFLMVMCGLFLSMVKHSYAEDTKQLQEGTELTHAYISAGAVSSLLGKFVLIRKGTTACLVRFVTFHSEGADGKSTAFFTREPTRTAEVEWYFQGDGSFSFDTPNVITGKASLRNTSSFGIGRLAFKPTATLGFSCGTISIGWSDGKRIGFYDENSHGDFEREIAPSKWSDLKEVDFSNPKLIWVKQLKYSAGIPEIKSRYVSLEELP